MRNAWKMCSLVILICEWWGVHMWMEFQEVKMQSKIIFWGCEYANTKLTCVGPLGHIYNWLCDLNAWLLSIWYTWVHKSEFSHIKMHLKETYKGSVIKVQIPGYPFPCSSEGKLIITMLPGGEGSLGESGCKYM